MPLIVTGCRPTYWKCGETGDLFSYCPEKKASVVLGPAIANIPLVESSLFVSPVMCIPTRAFEKPFTAACVVAGKGEWHVVVRDKMKHQTARLRSTKEPTSNVTYKPTSPLVLRTIPRPVTLSNCDNKNSNTNQVLKKWKNFIS